MRVRFARYWLLALALVVAVVYLFPVYWMLATSLKRPDQIFTQPPLLVPLPPVIDSYIAVVFSNPSILRALENSLIIAVGTTAVTLLIALPAAYGLARFRIRWATGILMLFLVVQMVPTVNIALPLFAIFSQAGLINTFPGLILADAALTIPMCIVIMRPYFLSVPGEVLDAARTDGCNSFTAFLRIALPISRPGVITIAALSFLAGWGEYVLGLSLTVSDEMQPLTVVIAGLTSQSGTRWNDVMALSTAVALPILLLFIVLQRYIVGGLTEGAGKS
jgi:multiple sugar transport system permease protein